MTNEEIMTRLKNDIRLRGLSDNTYDEYVGLVQRLVRHSWETPAARFFLFRLCGGIFLCLVFILQATCGQNVHKSIRLVW